MTLSSILTGFFAAQERGQGGSLPEGRAFSYHGDRGLFSKKGPSQNLLTVSKTAHVLPSDIWLEKWSSMKRRHRPALPDSSLNLSPG